VAQIKIHRDGTVETLCGTQDIGGGARTVVLIRTSAELGYIPLEKISVKIGRSEYGASSGSAGSSTTGAVTREIRDAAQRVLKQLFELVGKQTGADPGRLEIRDGGVIGPRGGGGGTSWEDATKLIKDTLVGHAPTSLEPGMQWYLVRDDGTIEQANEENYKA
jgi:CO/xanthine dehydrogenase Mo-binding subunit